METIHWCKVNTAIFSLVFIFQIPYMIWGVAAATDKNHSCSVCPSVFFWGDGESPK